MKIIDNESLKKVELDEMKSGEVFKWMMNYYIKTDGSNENGDCVCVCLTSGSITTLERSDKVVPVNSKVVIE